MVSAVKLCKLCSSRLKDETIYFFLLYRFKIKKNKHRQSSTSEGVGGVGKELKEQFNREFENCKIQFIYGGSVLRI